MRNLRRLIVGLIILAVLVWAAGGPILRKFLEAKSGWLIDEISRRSDEHILVREVSGDLWSGLALDHVVIYADKDPAHLPLLSADRVRMRISLLDLIRGDTVPSSVQISGFETAIHIGPDGKIALPKWTFQAVLRQRASPICAGLAFSGVEGQSILITWEKGVLEIHKRFPNLSESVRVVFTQLEGRGEYVINEGFKIEHMTGDYLSTPVHLRGAVPTEPKGELRIAAEIGKVQFSTVFRDIDPLFRGAQYLPKGKARGEVVLSGSRERPVVRGRLEMSDGEIAGVSVVAAETAVSYCEGVLDLAQVAAETYDGTVEATARVNLLSETPLWSAVCTFKDIDLAQYLDSKGYYAYEVSGGFEGSITAEGDFVNRDSLVCEAEISSHNGRFLSPFSDRFMRVSQRAMPEAPVSEGDLTEYDSLEVKLRIVSSEILVDRFTLVSTQLSGEAGGKIGFDRSIDASGTLTVPVEYARRHPRFGRFVGFLPDELERASLDFSLTGWLYDMRFNAQLGENLLKSIVDQGSDLADDLGDSVTGIGN